MLIDTIDDSNTRCLNNVYDRDHCTYPSSNVQLDVVFSCRKARIRDMKVGVAMIGDEPLMSDHLPITVTIYDDHVPTVNKRKTMIWDVENANIDG